MLQYMERIIIIVENANGTKLKLPEKRLGEMKEIHQDTASACDQMMCPNQMKTNSFTYEFCQNYNHPMPSNV